MAVKTRPQLNAQAVVIRDEVANNANTATRVGGHMVDESDSYAMITDLQGQPTSNISSGQFDDARVSTSSVTQHESSLSITASQVSDFDAEVSNNASVTANTAKVSWDGSKEILISCSDLSTDLVVDTSVAYIRMPYGMTLTEVRASVLTAPTGSAITIDINESGTSVLSTKLTIDAGEKTSTTAATPPVISDSGLADDAEITIDIDAIGSTIAGNGLIITLIGTKV